MEHKERKKFREGTIPDSSGKTGGSTDDQIANTGKGKEGGGRFHPTGEKEVN